MDFIKVVLGDLHVLVATPWCEAISMLMAFVCGAIVGFEREKGHKAAGLRTQILICLGSAIFTVVSMSPALGGREPARIAAQIVTGVGFLGAGSILHDRAGIRGLTTAATIWTVSAIGIVVGAGYVAAGMLLSFGVLLVLSAFRNVEVHLGGRCTMRRLRVIYRPEKGKTRPLIVGMLDEARGPLSIDEESSLPGDLEEMHIRYCDRHRDHRHVLTDLAALPAVEALATENPSG